MMLWATLCLQATAQTAKEVQADFQQRFKNSVCTHPQEALKLAKTPQERDALQFLYAYMDWPDVTDYAPQFMLDNARLALQTRTDFPWAVSIVYFIIRCSVTDTSTIVHTFKETAT